MPDKYTLLPFMISAITTIPGARVNINRIIEALVIAGLTASISLYGVTKVIETKLDAQEKRLASIEQSERDNTNALKASVDKINDFIFEHIQARR